MNDEIQTQFMQENLVNKPPDTAPGLSDKSNLTEHFITQQELTRYQQLKQPPDIGGILSKNPSANPIKQKIKPILLTYDSIDRPLIESCNQFAHSQGVSLSLLHKQTSLFELPKQQALHQWQNTLKQVDKIIVVVSYRSYASPKLLWELGTIHQFKQDLTEIALLPIANDQQQWIPEKARDFQEFYLNYPCIGKMVQGMWCVFHASFSPPPKLARWMLQEKPGT